MADKTISENDINEQSNSSHELTPQDHFVLGKNGMKQYENISYEKDPMDHFGSHDFITNTTTGEVPKDSKGNDMFMGSMTNVKAFRNDPETVEEILKYGLENYETNLSKSSVDMKYNSVPISPLQPFTNMDPEMAKKVNFITYNRTRSPVSDSEFRKGYKYIFFTRPECYVMGNNNGKCTLCEQAKYDADFSSTYSRMPHVIKLLAPFYITKGSFSKNTIESNWNYLLSNRVLSVNSEIKTSIGVAENTTKSIDGHTIISGKTIESTQGGTLSITFRDTKDLEVYEFIRLWILYIHKIKKGIFAPSYNGYQYQNGFINVDGYSDSSSKVNGAVVQKLKGAGVIYHPYDRALDYTASLFEFVTNESGKKIIYWMKHYGIYPTEVSLSGLNDQNGEALMNGVTVNATFRYQKREANSNRTLVEFNYNAGVNDDMGRPRTFTDETGKFTTAPTYMVLSSQEENRRLKQYMGPINMFTGTPYVVMCSQGDKKDPTDASTPLLFPLLLFSGINDEKINGVANLSLTNNKEIFTVDNLVGYN